MEYLGNISLIRNEQIWLLAGVMYTITLILVRSEENYFLREDNFLYL